ncbi:hypothetical protein [Streptomyces sp. NPDC048603]|uniref:hypothetical protein n=1 Tax=Streptomyces sp. NPDC048603 TaxID=3365577 RepID=UPI00371F738C
MVPRGHGMGEAMGSARGDKPLGTRDFGRARAVLERFSPLAWLRYTDARHRQLGHFQVPVLGWRFAEPRDELIPVFEEVVREVPVRVGRAPQSHGLSVEFSVRAEDGEEPSGFDLGDMRWVGGFGTADSVGRTPDQGMMIHLSVPELVERLMPMLRRRTGYVSFEGAASSFRLEFRAVRHGVRIAGTDGAVGIVSRDVLAAAVLRAAEGMAGAWAAPLSDGDAARRMSLDALAQLRGFVR